METRLGETEDDLLVELLEMAGEDHAMPQDRVRKGMRLLFAYLTALDIPAQATIGALVLKLGVDRTCFG